MTCEFDPRSVLVHVGLDLVGDALMKLPFVHELRQCFPCAHITWVAGRGTSVYASTLAPLVKGLIDEVIERADIGLHPRAFLSRPLGGRSFDLIIDTQRGGATTLALKRIPHRRFIAPFARFLFSSRRPPSGYRPPLSLVRQMLDLLELAAGHPVLTPVVPLMDGGPAFVEAAQALLPPGPFYVGLAPGAGGRAKCWPLDRFISLAHRQEERGRMPVFLLGPQEEAWEAPLRAAVPRARWPLQSEEAKVRFQCSPLLTVALGRRLGAAVSNDSGTGHMLALSGAPMISLFGPTSPDKFAPLTPRLALLTAQSWGGSEMERIPVNAVETALEDLLARAKG